MLISASTNLPWWVIYKLSLAVALFAAQFIVLVVIHVVDKRYSEQVIDKFVLEHQLDTSLPFTNKFPAKLFTWIRAIFFVGLLSLLILLIRTYQYYENQVIVQLFAFLLFVINVIGSYLLGSLKRNREIEMMANRLHTQIGNYQTAQGDLHRGELRLQAQNDALTRLAAQQFHGVSGFEAYARRLIVESAETLKVGRVSLWLYSPEKKKLICEALYQADTQQHSSAGELEEALLPQYFAALQKNSVVVVNDTYHDAATAELVAEYLPKSNVGALLDATIWLENTLVGVLCHEHIGAPREWTIDEQNFAGALANLLRVKIESHRRQLAETDLEYQEKYMETLVRTRTATIESNAKLSKFLVERAPVTILYMNPAGRILEMNPEAERVTGYLRDYAIGKTYFELFSTHREEDEHKALFDRAILGEKIQGKIVTIRCADGHTVDLSVSRSMQLDTDGNPIIISIGQDVSQQKALEASLQRAKEAAESADRIKSMFVASMSHELRTPLNSIIGFLGVVLQGMSGAVNEKQKEQLSRAYQSSRHLLALITDVIDISKIEAGFLQVHAERFVLLPLLIEAEHAVKHITQEKNLQISIECPKNVVLLVDRKRLYQVVLNVLSNAVKYTEKGSVVVKVRQTKDQVMIAMKDTGIGIDEASLAKLFTPFERVESRLKIKTLGTGLGLYLTQQILNQLLGGTIEVKSKLEVGSTFTIKVPKKMPAPIEHTNASIL